MGLLVDLNLTPRRISYLIVASQEAIHGSVRRNLWDGNRAGRHHRARLVGSTARKECSH
jgi:hypothetical protein